LIRGIENQDDWLKDYHKHIEYRELIRIATMYLLHENKDKAIQWFKENASDTEKTKLEIVEKMKANW